MSAPSPVVLPSGPSFQVVYTWIFYRTWTINLCVDVLTTTSDPTLHYTILVLLLPSKVTMVEGT